MIYEIVNPSDACTIEHGDTIAASLACLLLGEGRYALRGEDDSEPIGILIFGGQDALKNWLAANKLGEDVNVEIDSRRAAIADALESITYGRIDDRAAVLAVVGTSGDKLAALARWNDAKRSSMNDMSSAAFAIAKQLREPAKGDRDA